MSIGHASSLSRSQARRRLSLDLSANCRHVLVSIGAYFCPVFDNRIETGLQVRLWNAKETSMSATFVPEGASARDRALAAIEEAIGLIGQADQESDQTDELAAKRNEGDRSESRTPKLPQKLPAPRGGRRKLFGLLALGCVGIGALAWRSNGGEITQEPISTSSVQTKSRAGQTPPLSPSSDLVTVKDAMPPEAQTTSQSTPTAPAAAPVATELTLQVEDIARELSNVAQGIDRLKAEQSPIAHEMAERLKETDAVARHNVELTEDIKATQSQLTRAIDNLTDQLKSTQVLVAAIAEQLKQTQEQVAHLVSSEQRQRPRIVAPPPPTVAGLTRRPAPKPPAPAGPKTQSRMNEQPKQ